MNRQDTRTQSHNHTVCTKYKAQTHKTSVMICYDRKSMDNDVWLLWLMLKAIQKVFLFVRIQMMFQWTQMGMRLHFNANTYPYKHLCAHTKIYWKVFIAFESFFKDELAFQIVDAHIIWLSLHFAINYFILKRNEKNAFPNGSTVMNITAENMPYSFACVFFFSFTLFIYNCSDLWPI